MPELAESFILTAQFAQLLGVPFETDSRLMLPKRLEVDKFSSGPYSLVIHDFACICGDQSIEDDLVDAIPTRVQHQGKKGWVMWKTKNGALEIEIRYGMTGTFSLTKTAHSRLELKSPVGSIYYNDIRKFGGFAIAGGKAPAVSVTGPMNVEQVYHDMLVYKDSTVKELLVEQDFLFSGVGNYLVNEACFRAKIHPDSHAGLIDLGKFTEIVEAFSIIVHESVEYGGCTLRDFKDTMGRSGMFQHQLLVYGQKECPHCGGPIVPLRRPGETTSWVCAKCQDLRRLHPLKRAPR